MQSTLEALNLLVKDRFISVYEFQRRWVEITGKPTQIRSVTTIGALWPRCTECRHIAQSHDSNQCCEHGIGQCKECGSWAKNVQCKCTGYKGPTLKEFCDTFLTDAERAFYNWTE